MREYEPFTADEDAYMAAEQQRDMEEHRAYLQLTYEQLRRRILTGDATESDAVSLDILARHIGLDVVQILREQAVDYPVDNTAEPDF